MTDTFVTDRRMVGLSGESINTLEDGLRRRVNVVVYNVSEGTRGRTDRGRTNIVQDGWDFIKGRLCP